ncbi:hypothetical protein FORC066_3346 [Yersinia enterocolitica]|nr:hypothetical protein FORC066_3346 [Yersinia enterocolitica]
MLYRFTDDEVSPVETSDDLSVRDYMAAKYMQGVSANPERLYSNDDLAEEAYQMADAMIKARG